MLCMLAPVDDWTQMLALSGRRLCLLQGTANTMLSRLEWSGFACRTCQGAEAWCMSCMHHLCALCNCLYCLCCFQVHVPEGLTALDLDIIKLTAQFVARNGAAFLTGLTQREANNPQVRALHR